jgi:hypothetical protein
MAADRITASLDSSARCAPYPADRVAALTFRYLLTNRNEAITFRKVS